MVDAADVIIQVRRERTHQRKGPLLSPQQRETLRTYGNVNDTCRCSSLARAQVLDARDPLSCRSPEVERFIRKRNPEKKIVLLLNKIGAQPA